MKVRAIIHLDGTVVNEVVDREQHLCTKVYTVTDGLGRQISDEEIGPECDTANEFQGETT
jgi:hypothetical protein